VQSKLLNAHPHARLRVYAIWVNKLFGDARNRWDAAGLTDPRVVHLWDADDVSGGWLADNVTGYRGGDWDTYLLFGPDATWTSQPHCAAPAARSTTRSTTSARRSLGSWSVPDPSHRSASPD
jgi:hypothetical protein